MLISTPSFESMIATLYLVSIRADWAKIGYTFGWHPENRWKQKLRSVRTWVKIITGNCITFDTYPDPIVALALKRSVGIQVYRL